MQELELLHEVLDVQVPWKIMHASASRDEQRLDIHIGYEGVVKKSLFGFMKKENRSGQTCPHCNAVLPDYKEAETVAVRHLQTAGFETWLHVPSSVTVTSLDSACTCNRKWRKPGTDCSPEVFETAEKLLKHIANSEQVQKVLGLTDGEMEQILELSDFQPMPEKQPETSQGEPGEIASEVFGMPGFNHPNWMKLVKKELPFETKMVALSMLLRRVQSTYEKVPTMDSGIAGVKMLRQFFTRNEKLLRSEIAQVSGGSLEEEKGEVERPETEQGNTVIPQLSSPVWQQIVEGGMTLHTNAFGLQMLISRALMNVKKNPGPASIDMGVRSIRNFFVTNEKSLEHEIAQLQQVDEK